MAKLRVQNIGLSIVAAAVLTVLTTSQAHAAVEYYTWGGFETVSQAFQRVALIFSSNGYKAFLSAITMMGLVMGGFSAYYKMATGQSRSALSWLIPIVFGAAVYAAFYVPKENVNVYDPVLNRTTTVADVPIGVSKSVWLVNLFERFLIKTLDDNPAHINEPTYGAVGIAGFEGATNLAHALEDSASITQTFQTFMKDCAMFELTRPGSPLTWEQLVKPPAGSTLLTLLGQAKNPAMYTTEYMSSSAGNTVSCDASYDIINNYYSNASNSNAALGNACFSSGFVDTGQCQTNMASILTYISGDMGVSTDPVLTSANMRAAQGVVDFLKTSDATGATAASVGFADASKSVGKGLLSSFVNPKMINAYVAYAITLMPLMILFIATPLGRQAVGLCMSLVLWTMIIRGLDVMLFHMWAGELLGHVKSVGQIGNGVALKVSYADLFDSQLSSLADLRSSLFLLATAITGAMFKFGDSAMARLADKADQAHGAGYASGSGDRERQASSRASENASAMYKPSSVMANMARGAAMNELASAYAGAGKLGAAGGGVSDMLNKEQHAAGVQAAGTYGQTAPVTVQQAGESGLTNAKTEERRWAGNGTAFQQTNNVSQGTTDLKSSAGNVTMQGNDIIGATNTAASNVALNDTRQAAKNEQLAEARQRVQTAAHDYTQAYGANYQLSNGVSTQENKGEKFTNTNEFAKAREAATKSALSDSIKRGEQIADTKENKQSQDLYAQAQAKGGVSILGNEATIGGGYKVSYQTSDGRRHQMTMGADKAKLFEQSFAEKMSSTMKQAKTKEMGFTDSRSAAAQRAFTEAAQATDKYSDAISKSDTLTKSWSESDTRAAAAGAKLETAMVDWYAKELGGGKVTQDSAMNAVANMKEMEKKDPKALAALEKRFLESQGLMPKSEVEMKDPTGGGVKDVEKKIEQGKSEILHTPETMEQPKDPGPLREKVKNAEPQKLKAGHVTGKKDMEKDKENIGRYGGNLSYTPFGLVADTALTSAEGVISYLRTGQATKGAWGQTPDVKNVQNGYSFSGMSSEERAFYNVSNFLGGANQAVAGAVAGGYGPLVNAAQGVVQTGSQVVDGLKEAAPKVAAGVANAGGELKASVQEAIPKVVSGMADAAPQVAAGVVNAVPQVMQGLNTTSPASVANANAPAKTPNTKQDTPKPGSTRGGGTPRPR